MCLHLKTSAIHLTLANARFSIIFADFGSHVSVYHCQNQWGTWYHFLIITSRSWLGNIFILRNCCKFGTCWKCQLNMCSTKFLFHLVFTYTLHYMWRGRSSAIGRATRYRLDSWGPNPGGGKKFSLPHTCSDWQTYHKSWVVALISHSNLSPMLKMSRLTVPLPPTAPPLHHVPASMLREDLSHFLSIMEELMITNYKLQRKFRV